MTLEHSHPYQLLNADSGGYIYWSNPRMQLDGYYTIEELKRIIEFIDMYRIEKGE